MLARAMQREPPMPMTLVGHVSDHRSERAAEPAVALFAVVGALLLASIGSALAGIALAAGWIAMSWPRVFAAGFMGGATVGLVLGALIALVRRRG